MSPRRANLRNRERDPYDADRESQQLMREAERCDWNYEMPVTLRPAFVMLVMVRMFVLVTRRVVIVVRIIAVIVMVRMIAMRLWRQLLKMQMRLFVVVMAVPDDRA
jgi:hypothetical protein